MLTSSESAEVATINLCLYGGCVVEKQRERESEEKNLSFAIHWRVARRSVWYVGALCNSSAIIFGETMGAVVQRTTSAQQNIQLYYLFFSQKSKHMLIQVFDPIELISSWLVESDWAYFFSDFISCKLATRGTECCACGDDVRTFHNLSQPTNDLLTRRCGWYYEIRNAYVIWAT